MNLMRNKLMNNIIEVKSTCRVYIIHQHINLCIHSCAVVSNPPHKRRKEKKIGKDRILFHPELEPVRFFLAGTRSDGAG